MAVRCVSIVVLGALALACAGPAVADEYRQGELLGLDLSKALLSPRRLGPATEFAPVAVEARSEVTQARAEPKVQSKVDRKLVVRTTKVRQARVEKPQPPARTRLARRHANPLDAQAMDTRVQVWPCRSGGICDWKR